MCEQHQETAAERAAFVMEQIRTMRETPPWARCHCRLKLYLPNSFRCLYCLEHFCQRCAEEHFGKTRDEWKIEQPELWQALQDADLAPNENNDHVGGKFPNTEDAKL